MSRENVEVVRRAFDLVGQEGWAALDEICSEFCDPGVEVRALGPLSDTNPEVRGREAVIVWLGGLFGTLNVRVKADEFIDARDSVVVVFRQIARGPASGAGRTSSSACVYGFRKGKISYVDGYRTKAEALEGVGLRE
jgi:ketosteroid isomerase-like protein